MRNRASSKAPEPWKELYEREARKQRALIADLRQVLQMLDEMGHAFGILLADENFVTLLRAEGLDAIPTAILHRFEQGR
jgi:hypothetical protein